MPISKLAEMTWEEVRDLDPEVCLAILPIGALEAHGPHLPLAADVIIAEAMARAGAERLEARGYQPVILPTFAYTAARFAEGFAGTISLQPEAVSRALVDIARSLSRSRFDTLAIANAHLDPDHIAALYAGVSRIREASSMTVAFPDVTRKPWALRLTDEFQSGACHAGQYESSIVLAERPDLVREKLRVALPAISNSLSEAIRDGLQTFEEAGGPLAYFGHPADASAEEGRETIDALGAILEEAVTGDS